MRRAGGTAQDDFGRENVSRKTCQSGDLDPNKFPDRGADLQMMWCDMERDGFHNLIELFFEEESELELKVVYHHAAEFIRGHASDKDY